MTGAAGCPNGSCRGFVPEAPFTPERRRTEGGALPPPTRAPFVELGLVSCFSFLRGASDAVDLATTARALGYDALGIADANTMAGVVRLHGEAKTLGLTPVIGCRIETTEGLEFNALLPRFAAADARVFGVSRDSVRAHDNFCAKQGFNFPLISDADEALCQAFDVIKMKNMYGKQVRGIERSTFLISPDGHIAASWRKVKVAGHAQAVLETLLATRD